MIQLTELRKVTIPVKEEEVTIGYEDLEDCARTQLALTLKSLICNREIN